MNKLCLGTVQFGMQYGINNSLGRQPNIEECFEILDCAVKHGINCFDTASGYGKAEEILGEYKNWDKNKINIISKIKPLQTDIQNINSYVLNECESSLKKIGINRFFGYLFHNAADMYNKELCNALKQCKMEGLAKNVGVSIYSPEDAFYAAQLEAIDFIQIPYNVLDPKFVDVYFKLFIHPLDNLGIDFYWLDLENEQNIQNLTLLKHYHFYDMQRDFKRRPLLLSEGNDLTPHRYPVLYSGKTKVSWDTLRKIPFYNNNSFNLCS